MAKVNFNLRKPDADSETPINVVIRYGNRLLRYSSNEKIHPKFWQQDPTKRNYQRAKETKEFPEYPEFNARLNNIENTIKDVFRRYRNDNDNAIPETGILKELLDKEFKRSIHTPKTLFGFIREFMLMAKTRQNDKTGELISPSTIKTYNTFLLHLEEFQKHYKRRIDFDTIDLDFYSDYTTFLMHHYNLKTSSVGKDIQVLKAILNDALERGLTNNRAFQSKKFKVLREKSESCYLNEQELAQIEKLDLVDNPRLDRVRDIFILGCWTGLRFADVQGLHKGNFYETIEGLEIRTTPKKTGKEIVIPVLKPVQRILRKYNGLPPTISNQKTNEYLKELGQLIEPLTENFTKTYTKGGIKITRTFSKWEVVSYHTARRSFCTNLYLSKFPILKIMQMSGHTTEKVFMRYIKMTKRETAIDLRNHFAENFNQLSAV